MGLNSYQRRYGAVVNINSIPPNRENSMNGRYPLAATYRILYDTENKARVMVEGPDAKEVKKLAFWASAQQYLDSVCFAFSKRWDYI